MSIRILIDCSKTCNTVCTYSVIPMTLRVARSPLKECISMKLRRCRSCSRYSGSE